MGQITEPSGAFTSDTYDSLNNLTQTQVPTGAKASYAYANSSFPYLPSSTTDTEGNTTSFGYTSQGLLNSTTDPSNHTWSGTYNSNGTLASETDENGHSTSYSYGTGGLLNGTTHPSPLGTESFSYDTANRLASSVDGKSQTTTYQYDALDRETKVAYVDGSSVSSTYNADGDLTSQTDSTGTTSYTYDTRGQLTSEQHPNGQTISCTYDPAGNLLSKTDANGTDTYTYNPDDTLASVHDPSGAVTTFAYDVDGSRITTSYPNGVSEAMSYDSSAQLTRISASGCTSGGYGTSGTETTWATNQRFSLPNDVAPGASVTLSITVTAPGTAGTDGLEYQPVQEGIAWFPQYLDSQVAVGTSTPTVPTGTTSFVRTPDGQLLSERVPNGSGGSNTYYYLFDGLGSVVGITNSVGALVNSYAYDPYGNTTSVSEQVPNRFRYTGAIWDASTGLYQMGERYYDPTTGRFSQQDPAGGGYQYAGDNPINESDPTGLRPTCPDPPCDVEGGHGNNARTSTKNRHERADRRRAMDQNRSEKGDKRRKRHGGSGGTSSRIKTRAQMACRALATTRSSIRYRAIRIILAYRIHGPSRCLPSGSHNDEAVPPTPNRRKEVTERASGWKWRALTLTPWWTVEWNYLKKWDGPRRLRAR